MYVECSCLYICVHVLSNQTLMQFFHYTPGGHHVITLDKATTLQDKAGLILVYTSLYFDGADSPTPVISRGQVPASPCWFPPLLWTDNRFLWDVFSLIKLVVVKNVQSTENTAGNFLNQSELSLCWKIVLFILIKIPFTSGVKRSNSAHSWIIEKSSDDRTLKSILLKSLKTVFVVKSVSSWQQRMKVKPTAAAAAAAASPWGCRAKTETLHRSSLCTEFVAPLLLSGISSVFVSWTQTNDLIICVCFRMHHWVPSSPSTCPRCPPAPRDRSASSSMAPKWPTARRRLSWTWRTETSSKFGFKLLASFQTFCCKKCKISSFICKSHFICKCWKYNDTTAQMQMGLYV